MTWMTTRKDLPITAKLPYKSTDPKVVGRVPVSKSIVFDWLEFMLATAKASHLGYVAPHAAAPEVELMFRLVGPHVDDTATAFGVLASASQFKDYVGTFFTGTVAAGLAVRSMVDEGYVWFAHFESLGSSSSVASSPDYVMLGPMAGVALLEAKGSAAKDEKTFVAAVRKGYREQVRPHLGHLVGGVTATHGYSVGTWMRFGKDAEMRIAHTATKPAGAAASKASAADLLDMITRRRLLRQNYAGAFTLAYGAELGVAMRTGQAPPIPLVFARFEWRGKRWLSSLFSRHWWPREWLEDDAFFMMLQHGALRLPKFSGPVFAVENDIGKAALGAFLNDPDDDVSVDIDIAPLDIESLRRGGRSGSSEFDRGGAVLPDGLALIEFPLGEHKIDLIKWNIPMGQFDRIGSFRA
ncbi:MAG: hypothetical protein KGJ57_19285 [Sphingomonadales bacterium]|nr:hypothetical protein [Sphingomonadales bacterium]MDE2171540.1 hypothetical protein [Sphingomonadales bacterium]